MKRARQKPPIVLASASPRRAEILSMLGLAFSVRPTGVDESFLPGTPPERIVEDLAALKATSVPDEADALIIGSDTLVILESDVLGKPADMREAREMLVRLSGREHFVFTGLCVKQGERILTGHSKTAVRMRDLTSDEIDAYIQTGEPLDKAGAYAVQGLGAIFVEEIKGDFYTVVGLPVFLLSQFLYAFGVDVMRSWPGTQSP
ncbi:MAG: septum formation inhibitor Maf [Spirochaetia bacterium]|nr:septum formation inhibitor Maf [Spirochaetia bacterium]